MTYDNSFFPNDIEDLPPSGIDAVSRSRITGYTPTEPNVIDERPPKGFSTDKLHKGTAPSGQARLAPCAWSASPAKLSAASRLRANALCRMYDSCSSHGNHGAYKLRGRPTRDAPLPKTKRTT